MRMKVDKTRDITLGVIEDDAFQYRIVPRKDMLHIVCNGKVIAVLHHGECTIPEDPVTRERTLTLLEDD